MTEDVPVMESTLLILTALARNHFKFIVPINMPSSREEWMDLKIFSEYGRTYYASGFGSLWGEHWMGLNKIHCLTTRTAKTELRIDMADFKGEKKYAYYNFFMVGNADSNYKLQVAGYSGTAGDSILYGSSDNGHYLNGMPFSAHDRDNDQVSGKFNCASTYSPWWHKNCMCSTLNGRYYHDTSPPWRGINWVTFTSSSRSLKFVEMKLRARD